jgi:hypothetical protein
MCYGDVPPPDFGLLLLLRLVLDERRFSRLSLNPVSDANVNAAPETPSDAACCPACRGEIRSSVKRCPHCGRPTAGSHSFFYYAFWVALSLVVVALIACIFYVGFLLLNRML